MAICDSGEKSLQEATGIRRGRVYPVVCIPGGQETKRDIL